MLLAVDWYTVITVRFFSDCLILKVETLGFSETSVNICHLARRIIAESMDVYKIFRRAVRVFCNQQPGSQLRSLEK